MVKKKNSRRKSLEGPLEPVEGTRTDATCVVIPGVKRAEDLYPAPFFARLLPPRPKQQDPPLNKK